LFDYGFGLLQILTTWFTVIHDGDYDFFNIGTTESKLVLMLIECSLLPLIAIRFTLIFYTMALPKEDARSIDGGVYLSHARHIV
jgi:hypothetical protein